MFKFLFWMKAILILFFSELVGGHLVACIKRNFIKTLFFTVSKINLKKFYKNNLLEKCLEHIRMLTLNPILTTVGCWCPTLCYHAYISAMWGLVTWWPSCKLCMGSLVSLYALSATFIHSKNFVYLLQSSNVYRQLNSCVL